MESKEAGLASWSPVDEDEGRGGSAVLVHEVIGKHDISRRSLGELCKNKDIRGDPRRDALDALYPLLGLPEKCRQTCRLPP